MRCFTCNEPLANLWEYYVRRVAELEKEASKTVPSPASTEEKGSKEPSRHKNFDKNYKRKILDELELDNMCCRRHLLGHVELIGII